MMIDNSPLLVGLVALVLAYLPGAIGMAICLGIISIIWAVSNLVFFHREARDDA